MTLQLQVGKKYRRRDGEVVEIVGKRWTSIYPWSSRNGHAYRHNGKFFHSGTSSLDLIEEIPNTPPLQLKVGGRYRRRDGKAVEITVDDGFGSFPIQDENGAWYTRDGKNAWTYYDKDMQDDFDIIEELPNTKDNDMKQFDLAAVDKLTALSSEGRQQVKQLVTEVVTSLGGQVKEEVVPKVGQVWVSSAGTSFILNKFNGVYRAARLDGMGQWQYDEARGKEAVEGLTYVAASVEEYYAKKAKGEL